MPSNSTMSIYWRRGEHCDLIHIGDVVPQIYTHKYANSKHKSRLTCFYANVTKLSINTSFKRIKSHFIN